MGIAWIWEKVKGIRDKAKVRSEKGEGDRRRKMVSQNSRERVFNGQKMVMLAYPSPHKPDLLLPFRRWRHKLVYRVKYRFYFFVMSFNLAFKFFKLRGQLLVAHQHLP